MEVLERNRQRPSKKNSGLKPLLAGEIRSAFWMTEPRHGVVRCQELSTSAVLENGEWVINRRENTIVSRVRAIRAVRS